MSHIVGIQHHNINKLQRELGLTKLTVVTKRDGSEYLRIEAATQARVSNAQRALADEVAHYLRQAPSMRKRKLKKVPVHAPLPPAMVPQKRPAAAMSKRRQRQRY